MTVEVIHADSRVALRKLKANSVDAVVCDPPYALISISKRFSNSPRSKATENTRTAFGRTGRGFMGETWDTGEVAFSKKFWRQVRRVLKPGGHVVAFGADKTYHRLAVAIEDAGFEIRRGMLEVVAGDSVVRGFLDSLDDAQRQAFARVLDETEAGGLLAWIYGCGFTKSRDFAAVTGSKREGGRQTRPEFEGTQFAEGWGTDLKPAFEAIVLARKPLEGGSVAANVARWGTGALNVGACAIGEDQVPTRAKGKGQSFTSVHAGEAFNGVEASTHVGRAPATVLMDGSRPVLDAFPSVTSNGGVPTTGTDPHPKSWGKPRPGEPSGERRYGDRGSTSFTGLPGARRNDKGSAGRFFYSAKADPTDRLGSGHPTVKPVDLMRWLVTLVTPAGGVVLDPFAGTGTTGLAALGAGFDAILIEKEAKYVADIRRRLEWAAGRGGHTALETARKKDADDFHEKAAGADLPLLKQAE